MPISEAAKLSHVEKLSPNQCAAHCPDPGNVDLASWKVRFVPKMRLMALWMRHYDKKFPAFRFRQLTGMNLEPHSIRTDYECRRVCHSLGYGRGKWSDRKCCFWCLNEWNRALNAVHFRGQNHCVCTLPGVYGGLLINVLSQPSTSPSTQLAGSFMSCKMKRKMLDFNEGCAVERTQCRVHSRTQTQKTSIKPTSQSPSHSNFCR